MIVWFATGNIHKKEELADILSGVKETALEIRIPKEAGLEFDPEETGTTFLENALIKAEALHRLLEEKRPSGYTSGDPVIADDSGLCVDALAGRPGIYSARYCGPEMSPGAINHRGTQSNPGFSSVKLCGKKNITPPKLPDTDKNALLLAELGDNPRRSARFVCAMVLYYGSDRFFAAQETMEGELVPSADAARGKGGFGYDPILYIPEMGRTVAELSEDEKNRMSHRGKAGRAITNILFGRS